MKTTGDQQLVKRINRSVLLRLLRQHSGLSRAQLAQHSGLTKSTVSLLVRELMDEGWVSEKDVAAAKAWVAPSTPLQIDGHTRGLIGVEVAVEALRVVGVSLLGKVLSALEEPLEHTAPEVVCRQAARLVARVHAELVQRGVQLAGIGVGLPGAFDEATGVVRFAPNLGWRNVDFVSQITQALACADVPRVAVHVQNEADTAALSEYEFLPSDARDSLIFVTCGAGVGAGIVLNDRLFTGLQGMAGEIGHSILQIDGPRCSCGRQGCAETFFGARALTQLSDPAQGGRYLGLVLQNLWTTFNPSVLVVGGPSCERYPGIVQVAQDTLQSYAASCGMTPPTVRPAHYGLLASAVGAAALVLHHELRPMHPPFFNPYCDHIIMFLGIDIGNASEVKVLLLTPSHQVLGSAGTALSVSRPHPGHSEQNPHDWWAATQSALAQLRAAHPQEFAAVQGIGLSGQMHGAVLLDAQDQVLRPAILWNDTRCAQECVEMMAELPSLPALAGLAMPGFTAPKLRWVAKHEPDIFKRVAKVLLPKDYVRLMLTGEYVSDMSDASGTLWLDVQQRAWSDDLLALTNLTQTHMPRLVEGSAPSGFLKSNVAQALGLPAGIVVAGGASDNAASAVGMGAVDAGQGFLSLDASGVLFVVTPSFQPNAASATHAFCHALPQRQHQMSVMLSAASCLQWVTDLLGAGSAAAVESQAAALTLAERAAAPLFLPYLSGERTPHNDAKVRGSFHELSFDTDARRLGYAVMEGVSFGLKDGLAALHAAGSSVQRLSLVGGGGRSAFWAQQLASALNTEVLTHGSSTVGGALGAARLAWLATGAAPEAVCLSPEVEARYHPDPSEQALLAERYARFRSLYTPPSAT